METHTKKNRIAKTLPSNKRTAEDITMPDLLLYYRAKSNKNSTKIDMLINGAEVKYVYTYGYLIFDQEARNTHWKKTFLTDGAGQTR